MKTFLLAALITSPAFSAPKAPAPLNEGRCFDIKQSILADLPRFCARQKTDKTRLEDFGHQIDLLERRCGQPQLARLFRKALDERVNKESASGCEAATEKSVLPAKSQAKAASDEL